MAKISSLEQTVVKALLGRSEVFDALLVSGTDCMRLFRGSVDGIPGWVVDRFGEILWVQYREGECPFDWDSARGLADRMLKHAAEKWPVRRAYLKRYVRDRSRLPSLEQSGVEMEVCIHHGPGMPEKGVIGREYGVCYRILPSETFSSGLFLDQRENRKWVREQAGGLRVLNLFSYTGGFSVSAALGGATEVTTVDVSKKWLGVACENFELNGLDPNKHRFVSTGALDFLERAEKKGEQWDLIIADPPSFSRSDEDGVFSLKTRGADLLTRVHACLERGPARFLFSCNWQGSSQNQLVRALISEFSPSEWRFEPSPGVPNDCEQSENPIFARILGRRG